jgi:hypothetical protein
MLVISKGLISNMILSITLSHNMTIDLRFVTAGS